MSKDHLLFRGSISLRSDSINMLSEPGDAVLVERGRPRWLIMLCPCGCGEEIPINLDSRAGPAWRLYRNQRGITLYPSVWRDTGCQSHFIVWRNHILLFGTYGDDADYDTFWNDSAYAVLRQRVLEQLPVKELSHFSTIADAIDDIPWDVLKACRQLVRQGLALEGRNKQRGHFRRK